MKRLFIFTVGIIGLLVIVPERIRARRWRARWGTPIDKGNHPARLPLDYVSQARFSSEYNQVRTDGGLDDI